MKCTGSKNTETIKIERRKLILTAEKFEKRHKTKPN